MINYYKFFGIPETYLIDQERLRKLYYQKSREYHPDFYTLEAEKEQEEILRLSTTNNEAYKTLKSDLKRLRHLLEIKGAIKEDEKEKLSQSFLMEMMDLNESIMELQFAEQNNTKVNELSQHVDEIIQHLDEEINKVGLSDLNESDLSGLKELYFRKKYLNRLKDNISKL